MFGFHFKLGCMDERAKQILGRRVEETRRDLGISKVDFYVATGISRPYLDRIEDGTANFTLKGSIKIAPALGMTVSELLEGHRIGNTRRQLNYAIGMRSWLTWL